MKTQFDCHFWAEKLAARHPDDCTLDEQHALDAHVATCAACSVQRQQYLQLSQRVQAIVANEREHIFVADSSATFHRRSTSDHSSVRIGSVLAHRQYPAQRKVRPVKVGFAFVFIALFVLVSVSILQSTGHMGLLFRNNSSLVGSGVITQGMLPTIEDAVPPAPKGPYAVVGKPTITAAFINQVLALYHSPAAGNGQSFYDLGVHYNIDPAFALAFFMHESMFGTLGEARVTQSMGNLRCYTGAVCIDQDSGGYAKYDTWEDGFDAWYSLIRNYYVNDLGLTTIDAIMPTYAPTSDHIAEAAYILSLKHAVDTWHAGGVRVA